MFRRVTDAFLTGLPAGLRTIPRIVTEFANKQVTVKNKSKYLGRMLKV
jgi:hypothetical protein